MKLYFPYVPTEPENPSYSASVDRCMTVYIVIMPFSCPVPSSRNPMSLSPSLSLARSFSQHNLPATQGETDFPDLWLIVGCISDKAVSVYGLASYSSVEGDLCASKEEITFNVKRGF